jgi:SIR2-like domain
VATRRKDQNRDVRKGVLVQSPLLDLIDRIGQEIADENCVLFVGAGSSTEKWSRGHSFYTTIRAMTNLSETESDTFPAVMQKFCDERDGGHHNLLIREAIRYIEHFLLPGPANRVASEFGNQLAAIPFFKVVLTTNWDPLLERALDVLVPITQDRDLAFWDDRKKQVVKVHGCITRPHSIIATQSDYDSCVEANTLLFNKVRDLMATKTFLFTGYSLKDADFREIWETITSRLGQFSKLAYALDPFASDEDIAYWALRGIKIYRVRDTQFLEGLRKHFVDIAILPSQQLIKFLMTERKRVVKLHLKLKQDCDGGLSSAMYQDGLLHELDDILDSLQLGTRRQQDFENELGLMHKNVRAAQKQRDAIEVAYYSGRYAVINAFIEADYNELLPYFHPYRLTPLRKLVKGKVWTFPKVRKATLDNPQPANTEGHESTGEAFFGVCKHCAELMHKH